MDSLENFINFKVGIKIKNVFWFDKWKYVFVKWFNKLCYMLLIDDFKLWYKMSIMNIVCCNFLIYYDKSLFFF